MDPKKQAQDRLNEEIGERIDAARRAARLSYQQLADAAGTTEKNVRMWCKGEQSVRSHWLPAVCRALGVTADHLLGLPERLPVNQWVLDEPLLGRIMAATTREELADLLEWSPDPAGVLVFVAPGAVVISPRKVPMINAQLKEHFERHAPGLLDEWLPSEE